MRVVIKLHFQMVTGSQVFADNCELTGPEGSGTPPPSGNTVIRTRNGSQQTFTNPDLASLLNGAQNGDTYDIQGSYALSNEISIVNKSNIIIRSTGTEAVLDAYGLEVPIVETDSGPPQAKWLLALMFLV